MSHVRAQNELTFRAQQWQSSNDALLYDSGNPSQGTKQGKTAHKLPAGYWVLSPRSTAPFAKVQTRDGVRTLFLGDGVEVTEDNAAPVSNASFHTGTAIFEAAGALASGPGLFRPAALTIPARLKELARGWVSPGAPVYRSRPLDVRYARRAYLWIAGTTLGPSPVPAPLWVRHVTERGDDDGVYSGASTVPNNILIDRHDVNNSLNSIPLGLGSGHDTFPGTAQNIPDLRPFALLDWLQVELDKAAFDAAGYNAAQTYAWLTVEY